MQTYSDFERSQKSLEKALQERDRECINCPECGSQWFEQVEVARYKADHNLVLGQKVPLKPGTMPYILLRCINCKDVLEPRVLHNTRDVIGGDYNHFLDTVEGKMDEREVKEEPKKNNAIPSEKL